MRTRNRTIAVLALLAFVATGITLWLFSVSGKVCIARTGIEPPEAYEEKGAFGDAVSEMRGKALGSLVRSFDSETGFFTYERSPDGTLGDGSNEVRQLLASRVLAEESGRDASLRSLHENNLRAIMNEWYREEGEIGYVYAYEKSKLGANAMLLRVLTASPLFDSYKKEAERLVLGVAFLTNKDGSFEPWLKEPSYEYDKDYLLTFYSGEAILALLEYAEKTGDELALDIAMRAQGFYVGEYVDRMSENYYPAYVPWHTLSLARIYEKTDEERYARAIFTMMDKLLEIQDTEEFIGRFYNPATPEYGTPHASTDAVYTEGLATAYAVARKVGNTEREARYYGALVRAFTHLERLQFDASWYRIFDDREVTERLSGGIRTGLCDSNIRIDSTAHTVDALSTTIRALK
jgi:hypothetical protein